MIEFTVCAWGSFCVKQCVFVHEWIWEAWTWVFVSMCRVLWSFKVCIWVFVSLWPWMSAFMCVWECVNIWAYLSRCVCVCVCRSLQTQMPSLAALVHRTICHLPLVYNPCSLSLGKRLPLHWSQAAPEPCRTSGVLSRRCDVAGSKGWKVPTQHTSHHPLWLLPGGFGTVADSAQARL